MTMSHRKGRSTAIAAPVIDARPSDLLLQSDATEVTPGTELRRELLSSFAWSVVEEMDHNQPPIVPDALATVA